MGKVELIKEKLTIYCKDKNEYVSILVMRHPIKKSVVSRMCDYAISCKNVGCEYKEAEGR